MLSRFSPLLLATLVAAKKAATAVPEVVSLPTWQLFAAMAGVVTALGVAGKSTGKMPAWASAALGAAAAFSLLEVADAFIPYPLVAGPHAAVVGILFAAPPKNAMATAKGVLGGHIVAVGAAILLQMAPLAGLDFALKTLVVMAAVGAQKATDTVHPPACGVAFMWAAGGKTDPAALVGPLIGCAILIAVQQAWVTKVNKVKLA